MGAPTTTNQTAQTIADILQQLISGAAIPAVQASIVAAVPWLGLPIISWLLGQLLSWVGSYFTTFAAQISTTIVIDIQVNGEQSAVVTTANQLQTAINSGDQNAINSATQAATVAWGNLIHYDGSASV